VPGELGELIEGFISPYRDSNLEERFLEASKEAQTGARSKPRAATLTRQRRREDR